MLRFFNLLTLMFLMSVKLSAGSGFLDLPIHLGMDRTEIEEVLRSPLFSYAEDFKVSANEGSTPTLAYALYKVPDWGVDLPDYVLAFYLDGYITRLIGLYSDRIYQKIAWEIANQPDYKSGRYQGIEYYANKDYMAYYILQVIQPGSRTSVLDVGLRNLIFEATGLPHLNIVFYYDEAMFQLLYQSIKDLNLLSDIFHQLLSRPTPQQTPPNKIEPAPPEPMPLPDPYTFSNEDDNSPYPDGGEAEPPQQ